MDHTGSICITYKQFAIVPNYIFTILFITCSICNIEIGSLKCILEMDLIETRVWRVLLANYENISVDFKKMLHIQDNRFCFCSQCTKQKRETKAFHTQPLF